MVKEGTVFTVGHHISHAGQLMLKKFKLPGRFQESIFKGKAREGSPGVCDPLVHNSLIC